ncbi:MAG: ABC transporter permease subunit [Spirochaetales bacterium]|jgi:ABC-2 type transport system permease protein|nr:ABC transporter permease subunit [Spirochaetales bacterium]
MFTIFWRSIKDRKISLIAYLSGALLFMWMYIALFPTIAKEAEAFTAMFDNFPPAMFEIFGIEDFSMSTLENFLSVEHFSLVLPIMAIFLLTSFSGRAVAGEIELGTIELLIGRPVSRTKLFLARYLSGISILVTFTVVAVFSVIPLAALHGIEYQVRSFAAGALILFLFGWVIFSMTMMFSSFFSEKSKVYMAGGGILLVMYVLNIAALMNDNLELLKYFSFFHYYAFSDAVVHQTVYGAGSLVFTGVSLLCSVAGMWWFAKRDIAA